MTVQHQIRRIALLGALLIPLLLAACGGGGGSSATTSASTPTSTASQPTPAPVSSAPTQFTQQSLINQAVSYINTQRQQCGFAPIGNPQQLSLAQAARSHLAYMVTNDIASAREVSGNPGFTGVTWIDQATFAGYDAQANGTLFGFAPLDAGGTGDVWAKVMLSLIPGATDLFSTTDAGFAFAPYPTASAPTAYGGYVLTGGFPANLSASIQLQYYDANGTQMATPPAIPLTYPCQGSAGVLPSNPVPDFTTYAAGLHGTPIGIYGDGGSTIAITAASITPTGGSPVAVGIATATQTAGLGQSWVYPIQPLQPNTTYAVHLAGTENGTAFTRDFTFTTGDSLNMKTTYTGYNQPLY